jgi:hypothetical protein
MTTETLFGKYLDPWRSNKLSRGLKAKIIYEVVTHNPNSVNPLHVKIPQLE